MENNYRIQVEGIKTTTMNTKSDKQYIDDIMFILV